jgi:UDP-glucose 4-epimerase
MMRVLITGGAGFIGSHLADALLAQGHSVTCFDDLSLGRRENLAHLQSEEGFRLVVGNILEDENLDPLFVQGRFDVVFHMAANSDIQAGGTDRSVDLERTFLTTFKVLEAMGNHGVGKLVFASTSAIYGELDAPLDETIGPLFPISFYGAAKLAAEGYVSAFVANFGIQAWIFRFPNVVGERTTHGAIFDFINKLERNPEELEILGDGKQEKPYLYVKDLVAGLLFGWDRAAEPLNYFNLGVDSRTTVTRMAELVKEEMGLPDACLRYTGGNRGWVGDVPKFDYDLSKINSLGWCAERTSDDAVRLSIRAELDRRSRG